MYNNTKNFIHLLKKSGINQEIRSFIQIHFSLDLKKRGKNIDYINVCLVSPLNNFLFVEMN